MTPTESQFRQAIVDLAEWSGWRCYAVRRSDGILLNETGRGYPDLTLAREGQLVIPELKVGKNRLQPDQVAWAEALPESVHRVWRPDDWDEIETLLTRK